MKILINKLPTLPYLTLPTYLINKPNNLGFPLLHTTNNNFLSYFVHI
jgi:hypothetical protein